MAIFWSPGKRFSFGRFFVLEARSMASSTGRLLPSHLSDLMPACVRSTHTGDAKELCSSLAQLPVRMGLQGGSPTQVSSSAHTPPSLWNEMEPWHSNILVKTLHTMRCDIKSLKMVLRSLDFPAATHLYETQGSKPNMRPVLMMRSNSGMSGMNHTSRIPSDDEQIDHLKRDMGFASAAEKDGKALCVSEVPSSKNISEESESTHHGDPRQRKQWWRELLKALGLTVWVITGAVLVAKVIGVPNLNGVGQKVAYTGFLGRSESHQSPSQGIPSGVVELTFLNFNETIMKRPTLVMFYAPWCPHCQRLHPVWEQLADVLNKRGYDVQLAKVDAIKHTRLAEKYEIVGYPSLIMFKRGHSVGRHRGARDIDTLISFIDQKK